MSPAVPSYSYGAFRAESLLEHKADTTISVCLPARNEESTIGAIVETITKELMAPGIALVDEVLVVDDRSTDRTADIARKMGAKVVGVDEIMPDVPAGSGKGNVLWSSVAASHGDVIAWVDADLRRFDAAYVTGLLGPLLTDPSCVFVKAFYERASDEGSGPGGRTTELVARPLISRFFPELLGIRQPLAGEYAARRSVLEQVPFVQGYGVELGLLVDLSRLVGVEAFAQVDLGIRHHRRRPLHELGVQAAEILEVALDRAGLVADADTDRTLVRPGLETVEVSMRQRPPLIGHDGYPHIGRSDQHG